MSLPTNFFIGRSGGGARLAFSADSMDLSKLVTTRQIAGTSITNGSGGLFVDPNGNNFFTFDGTVRKYTMSTAHDITTSSNQVDYYTPQNGTGNRALGMTHDGTAFFLVDEVSHTIYRYSMQPWNISGGGGGGSYTLSQVNSERYPHSVRFDPTGYKMNIQWWEDYGSGTTTRLHHYTMTSPYDIGSRTLVSTGNYTGSNVRNMDWSDDGTFMAYAESGSGKLRCYYLSTPWDVSTLYGYQEYASFVPFGITGVVITGDYLYVGGGTNVHRFNV